MARRRLPAPREVQDIPRGGNLSKKDGEQLAIAQLPVPPILLSVVEAAWWKAAVGTLGVITRIIETASIHDLKWTEKMLVHFRAKAMDLADRAPGRLEEHGRALHGAVESAVLPPRGRT